MNKSFLVTKVAPHLVAVITFLMISIFIYRPIIFEGKVMDQNDINQGIGASSEISAYRDKTGEQILWTNSMFSGMPAFLISVRWSGSTIINSTQKALLLSLPAPVGENFLAFVSFYILLISFGVRPYLAIGGAIAFGLSTFYVVSIQAGHMWKIRAIAYMPIVFAGVHLVFQRKYLLGFILTAFALALEINANHLQITYYLFLLLLIYGVFEVFSEIRSGTYRDLPRRVLLLLAAGILAAGVNLGRLWSTYEYGKYSTRGASELKNTESMNRSGLERPYVFRWSSGKWESMTLMIPHLYGGASGVYDGKDSELSQVLRQNNVPRNDIRQYERAYLGYWGQQPGTAGPAYAGAVIVFLFILALFFVDKKTKYWVLTALAISIMLSWGKNFPSFNNLMFEWFPAYNKFRAVTMVIIIALMVLPLMAFLGLEKISSVGWNREVQKKLFYATGIAVFMALFAMLVTRPPSVQGVPDWLAKAIAIDRNAIIKTDVLRTVFYVLLSSATIYLFGIARISKLVFTVAIVLLILLDMALVDARYLKDDVYKRKAEKTYLSETPADAVILKDQEYAYRVLNLQDPFNEARTSNYHRSVGGYHGAKIRRYQDLISSYLSKEIQQIIEDQKITKANSGVISMLNTKYLLAGLQENAVIRNPYKYGAAWFVDQVVDVNSPDEELSKLGIVDLSNTAVIDKSKFEVTKTQKSETDSIIIVSYKPDRLVYKSNSRSNSLAVFSEVFYPKGWKAFIDGVEVEIKRANYILRCVEVPPGEHEILFEFEPASYFIGNKIMMISSVMLLLISAYGLFKWCNINRVQKSEVS
jgi:hypothetical protein